MAGGDGMSGTGTSIVPSPPVVAGGAGAGVTVTDVGGLVVVASVVVVVVSFPCRNRRLRHIRSPANPPQHRRRAKTEQNPGKCGE